MGEERGRRKSLGESRRTKRPDAEPLPDLSAFMNDRFFFGDTVNYPPIPSRNNDLANEDDEEEEEEHAEEEEDEELELNQKNIQGRDSGASRSRRTQEWLEEARQIVSSSPARRSFHSQPSPGPSILNYARHEHLSRSARRSFDSSPLSASAKLDSHPNFPSSRFTGAPNSITSDFRSNSPSSPSNAVPNSFASNSRPNLPSSRLNVASSSFTSDSRPNLPSSRLNAASSSFTSDSRPNLPSSRSSGVPNSLTSKENNVQNWFGNILKKEESHPEESSLQKKVGSRPSKPPVPGRQSNEGHKTLGDVLKKKHRSEGNEKKYSNGGTEEKSAVGVLSPPRRSMQIHVRSASASAYCGASAALATPRSGIASEKQDVSCLNNFLKKQRDRVKGGAPGHAKIVLSATNPSTSSMVATIGYAWLLAETGDAEAVPVINMKRTQMREQKQAACLFHHVGIDARSLLFVDEVDMDSFSQAKKLNVIMIGQDALHTNIHNNKDQDGVVSPCTLLIDEYYQQGYKLLEAPFLRKLLLAGILLDTENSIDCVKHKDARAIDLLLIDASPDHKNNLLHLLNEKHKDDSFEEVLRTNYGEAIIKVKSQATPTSSSSGKNFLTQTLSKWFGFGSK